MKRILLIIAALLLCSGNLWAQSLEVEKPVTLTDRQEAVKYERLDFNQVPCALLILHLDNDNVDFEGDIRTTQYRNGEWWIWMIQGSNWLTVKASQFTPLTMEFKGMQSGKTYEASVRAAVLLRLAISEDFHFDQSRTDAANAKYMRRDAQGRTCALVRMGLVLPEARITGPKVEHSEYRDGEWWVWLSPDATQMTVTADGYQPLALQFDSVRAASTYMLTLLKEGQRSYKRTDGYVDLGLPSGTLWKDENENHLTYDEAIQEFGQNMPTKEQWEELISGCKLSGNGQLTGPNGESIVLPAMGYVDCDGIYGGVLMACYWSATPKGRNEAWSMSFFVSDDEISIESVERCFSLGVRLVKPSDKDQTPAPSTAAGTKGNNVSTGGTSNVIEYVDLGLPSGTLWRSENEPGIYSQTMAVESYDDLLPTKEQLEELVEKCTWKWENKGFTVTGPNGKSIILPADGTQNCYGSNSGKKGTWGGYWSRTVKDSQNAWKLGILDPKAAGKYLSPYSISNDKYCFGYSVRLVKSK